MHSGSAAEAWCLGGHLCAEPRPSGLSGPPSPSRLRAGKDLNDLKDGKEPKERLGGSAAIPPRLSG